LTTQRRWIKPVDYPMATPEEQQKDAIRFIVSQVRASTNKEARDVARASANPALREAARILDERDAGEQRPQGVQEAERLREAADIGGQATEEPSGAACASPPPSVPALVGSGENGTHGMPSQVTTDPHPRTPASVFQKQFDRLTTTVAAALNPDLVRVPAEISGTVFDCYALAPWPYTEGQPDLFPVTDAEPDDGYRRQSPGPIGAGHRVLYAVETPNGIGFIDAGEKAEGDDTPDLHQQLQRQMYARKNRRIAEWGTYRATSTQENAKNGKDPE